MISAKKNKNKNKTKNLDLTDNTHKIPEHLLLLENGGQPVDTDWPFKSSVPEREEKMSAVKEESAAPTKRLSCTKCFDALWFCYCTPLLLSLYIYVQISVWIHFMGVRFKTPIWLIISVYRHCKELWFLHSVS